MSTIINEILKDIPDGKISEASFEGANIVLYTKDKKFFLDQNGLIREIVHKLKKRIELRPDPSICMNLEDAKDKINKLIPKEAAISDIIFDAMRSRVIIEVEKPGLAIGKQGSLLREVKNEIFWIPIIRRKPALKCNLIEGIRAVLYKNSDYRRKFLDRVGHRVYDGWLRGKKKEWIRVSYLGGAREVGRSCLLLQTPESRILLDCGVNVAANDENAYPHLEAPELRIDELDAVILSHSHMDHCGFIPYLFKYGYDGPVYCTAPTRDVSALQLLDYVKIMRGEGNDPIFTSKEVEEMVKHTICLNYGEVTDITPDVRITLYNAGHILGSSMIHLHVGNGLHNLLYTGDMKYGKTRLLEPADTQFPRLETLMIESTYGGKDCVSPSRRECEQMMADIISKTLKDGGRVLFPVLGSGRAQEVLLIIDDLLKTGKIEGNTDVFIDGMVWHITAIHTAYPEFLNNSVRKLIFHKDQNPFLRENFKQVGSGKERKKIIEDKGPCIIMATSGMLVGGPSIEYLKSLSDNPKNSMVFTCYQGSGSLGNRIQRGITEFTHGAGNKMRTYALNLQIYTIQGLSGHSDRKELLNFVHRCNPKPKRVIVNHGESSRAIDLCSSLHKLNRIETNAPQTLDTLRIK